MVKVPLSLLWDDDEWIDEKADFVAKSSDPDEQKIGMTWDMMDKKQKEVYMADYYTKEELKKLSAEDLDKINRDVIAWGDK